MPAIGRGPRGPRGPQGPQGPEGDAGTAGSAGAGMKQALITLSGNMSGSNLTLNNHIEFDTLFNPGSAAISLATGVGQADGIITLGPGHSYWLEFQIGGSLGGSTASIDVRVYDRTGAAYVPANQGSIAELLPTSAAGNSHAVPAGRAYVDAGTGAKEVELRISAISGSSITLIAGYCWIKIIELT